MPKRPRFAPPGCNLHITQRGNYGQQTFFTPSDHRVFLDLIAQGALAYSVAILAYCLMPNHYHLILVGHQPQSVPRFMQFLNGQYAQYVHWRLHLRGRFWQDRYYSCALDQPHLVAAFRYVERNPVRAKMCPRAADHLWSSTAIHLGALPPPPWLDMAPFDQLFTPAEWEIFLEDEQCNSEDNLIRQATRREAPAGTKDFVEALEREFGRTLSPRTAGRPRAKQATAAE